MIAITTEPTIGLARSVSVPCEANACIYLHRNNPNMVFPGSQALAARLSFLIFFFQAKELIQQLSR